MKTTWKTMLTLLAVLCMALPVPALAGGEDADLPAAARPLTLEEALDRAVSTQFLDVLPAEQAAALTVLQPVTEAQLAAWADSQSLPLRQVRRAYYASMVVCLQAEITLSPGDREDINAMRDLLRLIDRDRELDDWFDDWEDIKGLERLYGDDWDDRYDDD